MHTNVPCEEIGDERGTQRGPLHRTPIRNDKSSRNERSDLVKRGFPVQSLQILGDIQNFDGYVKRITKQDKRMLWHYRPGEGLQISG